LRYTSKAIFLISILLSSFPNVIALKDDNQTGCLLIDKNQLAQYISFEGVSNSALDITLRLHNNTSCSIFVETDDRNPTKLTKLPNGGIKVETVTGSQDGVRLPLHYFIQDRYRGRDVRPGYDWGDSVYTYELLAGQSAVFTIPITQVAKHLDLAVPFQYSWENKRYFGIQGKVVHRIYFPFDDISRAMLRRRR
jgi:hypothetical protein